MVHVLVVCYDIPVVQGNSCNRKTFTIFYRMRYIIVSHTDMRFLHVLTHAILYLNEVQYQKGVSRLSALYYDVRSVALIRCVTIENVSFSTHWTRKSQSESLKL